MRQKSVPEKEPATEVVKKIRRATRRHFSAEDKIRIVLEARARMCARTQRRRHGAAGAPYRDRPIWFYREQSDTRLRCRL